MSNDLISREELKRKLQYVYSCDYIGSKSKEGIVSDIIDEIDNAPTIEYNQKSLDYDYGFAEGYMRAKEEYEGERKEK